MSRTAQIKRETRETSIRIRLDLDEAGESVIQTGVAFVDHMFEAFARHGRFGLRVEARGDLEVDAHHTLEDLGLVLGQALKAALGDKAGIGRFGAACIPMDEALIRAVIDLSGRPFLAYRVLPPSPQVGGIDPRLFREFFQAFVNAGGVTLHLDMLAGEENHHIIEAVFKAFGRALAQAVRLEPGGAGVPSTKGVLE